jgi:hypothetical protein
MKLFRLFKERSEIMFFFCDLPYWKRTKVLNCGPFGSTAFVVKTMANKAKGVYLRDKEEVFLMRNWLEGALLTVRSIVENLN